MSTTAEDNSTALVSAVRRLTVALSVTVGGVILVASILVAIAIQSTNSAEGRAEKAQSELSLLQNTERCKTDILWRISGALVRNQEGLNAIVLALARRETPPLEPLANAQEEMQALEAAGLEQCLHVGEAQLVPPPSTTTTATTAPS